MGEELTGTQKAAALHGVAINRAYPADARLSAAIDALDIYEQEYERIHAEWEKVRQVLDSVGICGDTVPTVMGGTEIPTISCDLPANHPGWHGADNPSGFHGLVSRVSWSIASDSVLATDPQSERTTP